MKHRHVLLTVVIAFSMLVAACASGPPNPGFRVNVAEVDLDEFGFPDFFPQYNITVTGNIVPGSDASNATGQVRSFFGNSRSSAWVDVDGGRAPAAWTFGETGGACSGQHYTDTIAVPGENYHLYCYILGPFFTFSPNPIDKTYPPDTVTIYGSGISADGGMPTVEYYNFSGTLVASAYATQVAADGSWLSGPTPDLSSAGSGRYILVVRNPDGGVAGSGLVDVYEEYSPPPACNPSEGQVDNCISMIGCLWNDDSCSCNCSNP